MAYSLYPLMEGLRGLGKLVIKDWWWEKLGVALVGRALLSKALIQLSADGCRTHSLLVVWPKVVQEGREELLHLQGQEEWP